MRPESSKDKAQDPPQQSPARSGAGKAPSSPRGGKTSSGSATPKRKHSSAEEDTSSPPETEDPGASNTGTGSEETRRSEPLVPPVPEKSKHTSASPDKTSSSAPRKPASAAKGAPSLPPSSSKPPLAPSGQKPPSRKGATLSAEQLSSAVKATTKQPTISLALTLHTGAPQRKPARRSQRSWAGSLC
jgi:hypothetical protein